MKRCVICRVHMCHSLNPFTSKRVNSHSNVDCCLTSVKPVPVYSLLILTTSLISFSLRGWENVLFELGSERATMVASARRKAKFPKITFVKNTPVAQIGIGIGNWNSRITSVEAASRSGRLGKAI